MKKLIVDFDCAINLKGCDLDDAFALLYLLSCTDVDVRLVTTTFGNTTEENVYSSTKKMFEELNIDVPLYRGGINYDDAALKIKEVISNESDVSILSLGATTNTKKALMLGMDKSRVKSFTAMGGITEALRFQGKIMDELNFSIDYNSTNYVFKNLSNINIITGNNCMMHRFLVEDDYNYKSRFMKYLEDSLYRWTGEFFKVYKEKELVLWDVIAALYFTNPEFFNDEFREINLKENMKTGFLEEGSDAKVNIPSLKDGFNAMDFIVKMIEKNRGD